ncbi:hypothetical protein RQN30_01270 [Arcanobacterium hippocoleae]
MGTGKFITALAESSFAGFKRFFAQRSGLICAKTPLSARVNTSFIAPQHKTKYETLPTSATPHNQPQDTASLYVSGVKK